VIYSYINISLVEKTNDKDVFRNLPSDFYGSKLDFLEVVCYGLPYVC